MTRYFNIPFYTLGGIRIWRDVAVREGWKVQENLITKNCRLIDANGVRRVRAPERQCLYALQSYFEDWEIDDTEKEITLLIGGLFHHKYSFGRIADILTKEGFKPVVVCSSSYFASVDDNAKSLMKVLQRMPKNIKKVNFVTVGTGALILRKLLSLDGAFGKGLVLGRVVMIAPPNQGLDMAQKAKFYPLVKVLTGRATKYLLPSEVKKVPLPPKGLDFAVIAFDRQKGDKAGENNSDGLIKVKETKLIGMKDFIVFRRNHFFVTYAPEVANAVSLFLKTGRLVKNRKIDKIPDSFRKIMDRDEAADRRAESITLKDLQATTNQ